MSEHTKEYIGNYNYEDACKLADEKSGTVTKIIEEVAGNICDNFCKYRDTCDDNCECDWIRQGNACPLDRLY